ncbi:DUF5677 domain-containing protein [Mesorhizobium sp. M0047]|uniref:DUF5677 domain-containing protein n=2 Tax=unclassified Mesorhizobium TaxID=325217 RepID=UPI003336CCD9
MHKIFRAQIGNISKTVMRQLLEKKLARDGIEIPQAAIDALADHIASRRDQPFIWIDKETGEEPHELRNLTLKLDKTDALELKALTLKITERLPHITQEVFDRAGSHYFKNLKDRWPTEGAIQRFETDEFCERIEERWGEGLDLLRMLLTCCREFGSENLKRRQRSKSKKHSNREFVLTNLHARSCQVADEVITLMSNGFADGAMARWRTLHELSVVATLIADGDETLAERYINHDAVEVKRQADDYNQTQVPLGYAPIGKREQRSIDMEFSESIASYGTEFASPYGWAAKRLNKRKPTFKDLQEEAGRAGMNAYYKMASFNVHAGARTMFFRLSSFGRDNVLVAGRTNAGLVEPAQHTAYSLLQITTLLTGSLKNLDRILEIQTFIKIRDAIPKAFMRADRKLRRDEAAYQNELAARRSRKRKRQPGHTIAP